MTKVSNDVLSAKSPPCESEALSPDFFLLLALYDVRERKYLLEINLRQTPLEAQKFHPPDVQPISRQPSHYTNWTVGLRGEKLNSLFQR